MVGTLSESDRIAAGPPTESLSEPSRVAAGTVVGTGPSEAGRLAAAPDKKSQRNRDQGGGDRRVVHDEYQKAFDLNEMDVSRVLLHLPPLNSLPV